MAHTFLLYVGGLLVVGAAVSASAHDEPLSVEKKYSKQSIVACFVAKSKDLKAQVKALEQEAISLTRANKSVAPVVLQQRRIAEQICAIEAQCVADEATIEHKDLLYGQTFKSCLGG